MLVVDADWECVRERLIHQAEVGVPAVGVPASKSGRSAEVLRSTPTEPAAAVGTAEPGDTDPIAKCEPFGVLAERVNDANHLMTRGNVASFRQQVTLGKMQIGPADPAAGDLHTKLPAVRDRHVALQQLQRSTVNRSRLMHHPGVHHAILASR